jgi:hypothetical protein
LLGSDSILFPCTVSGVHHTEINSITDLIDKEYCQPN